MYFGSLLQIYFTKTAFWDLLMKRVQLSQGCRTTTVRQCLFSHYVLTSSWHSFDQSHGSKVGSILEPPGGFEQRTFGLVVQCPTIRPLFHKFFRHFC